VPELSRLARTIRAWEPEILAWHVTGGCSNGATEAVNLLIKSAWNGRLGSASLVGHPRRTAGGATTGSSRPPWQGSHSRTRSTSGWTCTATPSRWPPCCLTRPQRRWSRSPATRRPYWPSLAASLNPARLRACYEAGPSGYELARLLHAHGVACQVITPSLTPRAAGDKVKTDRRDTRRLARLHRAGELVCIRIPTPREEAVRDLCRARADLVDDRSRARRRLQAFLLRHGRVYRAGAC
jgi:Transposase